MNKYKRMLKSYCRAEVLGSKKLREKLTTITQEWECLYLDDPRHARWIRRTAMYTILPAV